MRRAITTYIAAITTVNRWLFVGAGWLMLVIVPVMLYAVISRYGFNHPSDWGLEMATLLFGPYFMLGGPYLLHIGGHVNLDILRQGASPRVNRIFDLINFPIIGAFAVILLYYSWPFAVQSWQVGETSYTSWNPPIWPIKFVIPLALVLLFLQALAEWLLLLLGDERRVDDPTGELL